MLQGLPEARNAMRSGAACGLALVVLCGASVPLFAQEDDAESAGQAAAEVAPGDYQQALAPYGAWVDDGSYGHVWQPAVGEEWQPYVDGSWAWTGDGWTWESDEPWGWTLHYGRWALSPAFGWVWVPGDIWGPAWVDWFSGDVFVGWAPLSPFWRSRGQQLRLRRGSELRRAQSEERGPGWESRAEARHRRPGRTPPPAHAPTDRARVAPSGAARREAAPDPGALGPTGREPGATLLRRPSTGSVAAGERDGARVGGAVHRPERARSWHSPHVCVWDGSYSAGPRRRRPQPRSRRIAGACRVRRRRSGDARARRRSPPRIPPGHSGPLARGSSLPARDSCDRVRPLSGTRRALGARRASDARGLPAGVRQASLKRA